jgi:TolB-like protein
VDVVYVFENFALDMERRELTRGSEPISIGPQVFDLLVYLVQNRERVVTKDDLLEAVWHGRIVSESTLASHINAIRKAVGDSGDEQRLIRTVPRKGFRFVGEVTYGTLTDGARAATSAPPLASDRTQNPAVLPQPDKPSIAVLPFQNMSDDPEQEYFADGMVEDIVTALSRMRWLFVIARNSSFAYKGRAVDVRQVASDLGVRYVLEGSVRKAADRLRVTGQLIDASTGMHIWGDRFEGALEDIFDLQDQFSTSVVGALAPQIEQAEIARAKCKSTENLDAYDYFLRGMASYYALDKDSISEALRLFSRAIELDPHFASAHAMAAWCYAWRKINGWTTDHAAESAETERLAWRAAALGPDDAVALSRGAHALGYVVGEVDAARNFIDRAVLINPNLAGAWWASGWIRVYSGDSDEAINHLARAMRLSPLDPHMISMQGGMAFAHFIAGRDDEALSWAEKAWGMRANMASLEIMAASNALTGKIAKAEQALARLRKLNPTLRMSDVRNWVRFCRPADLARLEDGLRIAGLPQ